MGVWGALAAADSQRSKCLRLRVRSGGGHGGGWGRGNRGAAAGVEARLLLRSEARGLWLGSTLTHPSTLSSRRPQTDFSPRSAVGRAGAGAARVVGAQSWAPTGGRPLMWDWQGRRAPPPPSKDTPQNLGAGRGVGAFPAFWKGRPQRRSCTSVRGLSEVAPLWLLEAAQTEGGSRLWESRSSFCLSAQTRGQNCRQTPTSPEALYSLSLFCLGRNSPRQPFLRPQ